jgi:hypothetical protein
MSFKLIKETSIVKSDWNIYTRLFLRYSSKVELDLFI